MRSNMDDGHAMRRVFQKNARADERPRANAPLRQLTFIGLNMKVLSDSPREYELLETGIVCSPCRTKTLDRVDESYE